MHTFWENPCNLFTICLCLQDSARTQRSTFIFQYLICEWSNTGVPWLRLASFFYFFFFYQAIVYFQGINKMFVDSILFFRFEADVCRHEVLIIVVLSFESGLPSILSVIGGIYCIDVTSLDRISGSCKVGRGSGVLADPRQTKHILSTVSSLPPSGDGRANNDNQINYYM
jgi:hypothetical protein